ncbi:MAG: translation elongation factor Ts [Candidatus Calescibacterium sp.]|nr:translation elongation factor Ts [Candidatus Calescibacterium sp.]MDW8133079.1 translation elongation factor Ts [Candidatus Calescibacterium sp.]
MGVSMDLIKQLREETGAGMTDCKNALIESNGDIEKARRILLAKGAAKAAKKLDRVTKEGVVYIKNNNDRAVIIELGCETDFVARNEKFVELAKNISEFLINHEFSSVEDALKINYQDSRDLQTFINENISIFGENIKLSRVETLKTENQFQVIFDYLHFNNRVGVLALVEFEKPFSDNSELKKEFGIKTVFQIASMKPVYVDVSSIPNEELEEQKRITFEQAKSEGKPEHIAQKIAEGKVLKIFEDNVLLEQSFYDDSLKLPKFKDYLNYISSKIGEKISVKKFVRFEIGK